jgi:hypothetical protein
MKQDEIVRLLHARLDVYEARQRITGLKMEHPVSPKSFDRLETNIAASLFCVVRNDKENYDKAVAIFRRERGLEPFMEAP